LYGKVSKTFRKSANKSLENHLCLSLILEKRTLDLYVQEGNIISWVYGLSQLIRAWNKNKNSFVYIKQIG
jgi:hypothetical protein